MFQHSRRSPANRQHSEEEDHFFAPKTQRFPQIDPISGQVDRTISPASAFPIGPELGWDVYPPRPPQLAAAPVTHFSQPVPVPAEEETSNAILQKTRSINVRSIDTHSIPPAVAPDAPSIQRAIASQIVPKEDPPESGQLIIGQVSIVGRPDKVFTDTMGDHTTAYAVHQKSLQQQLEGQTFARGFEIIKGFYEKAKTLPGMKLIKNLPTSSAACSLRFQNYRDTNCD